MLFRSCECLLRNYEANVEIQVCFVTAHYMIKQYVMYSQSTFLLFLLLSPAVWLSLPLFFQRLDPGSGGHASRRPDPGGGGQASRRLDPGSGGQASRRLLGVDRDQCQGENWSLFRISTEV